MMKKLINFLLVLVLGAALGYVFHNPIDTKLKAKFGADKVETVRAKTEKVIVNGAEKGKEKLHELTDSTNKE